MLDNQTHQHSCAEPRGLSLAEACLLRESTLRPWENAPLGGALSPRLPQSCPGKVRDVGKVLRERHLARPCPLTQTLRMASSQGICLPCTSLSSWGSAPGPRLRPGLGPCALSWEVALGFGAVRTQAERAPFRGWQGSVLHCTHASSPRRPASDAGVVTRPPASRSVAYMTHRLVCSRSGTQPKGAAHSPLRAAIPNAPKVRQRPHPRPQFRTPLGAIPPPQLRVGEASAPSTLLLLSPRAFPASVPLEAQFLHLSQSSG